MKRTLSAFFLGVCLVLPSANAAELSPEAQCAAELNDLVSDVFDTDVNYPFLGGRVVASTPYGWVKYAFPVFDAVLRRGGLPQDRVETMKAWLNRFRISQEEARGMSPDDPAMLALNAAITFFQLNRQSRVLYAGMVEPPIARGFPLEESARYLYETTNFRYVNDPDVAAFSSENMRGLQLERRLELLLFRRPSRGASDDELMEWVADLLAGITRFRDLEYISNTIRSTSRRKTEWFSGRIARDSEGVIVLAAPYFPLFLESRAQAVRAWVLHRLRGDDWTVVGTESQERALDTVAAYTTADLLGHYENLPNGLWMDHTVPIAEMFRDAVRD